MVAHVFRRLSATGVVLDFVDGEERDYPLLPISF